MNDRHVALSQERQHIKHVKHYYKTIAEINVTLSKVHSDIEIKIDKERYKYASEYVNQFISYTSIWNLKFVYNLENPEVALMQIFHLEYIFSHEPAESFSKERRLLAEQKQMFLNLNPYTIEHIQLRKQKMDQYLKEKNPTEPK